MSSFEGIERRVREECNRHGIHEAGKLRDAIAVQLGMNPKSTWGCDEAFLEAVRPLIRYAEQRYAGLRMRKLWGEAEQAALAVLKKGGE